ncbi:MAG TPA: SOS response-associated peptidase, partial [Arenimonas sp.]|nr:SOS response-associated peptidase [Arenimonas sp.]
DVPNEPRYNIAPSQQAWVLAADGEGGAKAGRMQWGLVPHWAKDAKGSYSTINARAETIASKPAFREPFKRRRCLVIASGYYEWLPLPDGKKQPYHIHPTDAPLMLMAGLWDRWQAPGGDTLLSFSIVTEEARGDMRQLHERRPVLLQGTQLQHWLYAPASDAEALLQAVPDPALRWHPVHPGVGNARAEGERLIAPLG